MRRRHRGRTPGGLFVETEIYKWGIGLALAVCE